MKKITPEEYENRFYSVSDNEYELLSQYKNKRTKVTIKHIPCGHSFEMLPNNFVNNGQRCPICRYLKSSKSRIKSASKKVVDLINSICKKENYLIIGEYKGYHEFIELKHLECDSSFKTTPASFINKHTRCPKCARIILYKNRTKTPDEFKNQFYEIANNEYELMSEYKNKRTKITIKHLKCGYEYETLPSTFIIDKCGCPQCNESKGEREIRRFLNKYGLSYKSQYRLKDCKNKYPLPFDYAIFNNDNSIKCLIEYQGIQHYEKTGFFKGIEKLEYTKQNDKIKEKYCNENNINLIIISYKEFNEIEKIIKEIC